MSMLQQPWDREQPDRSHSEEPFVPRKSSRRSTATIGCGALACPSCDVPIVLGEPVPFTLPLECPFCSERRPARQFVRLDVLDTDLSFVEIRARLRT
jgi:hypothetical protein